MHESRIKPDVSLTPERDYDVCRYCKDGWIETPYGKRIVCFACLGQSFVVGPEGRTKLREALGI